MSTPEKPAFTEDDVANDFVDAIEDDTIGQLGHGSYLRHYAWVGDGGVPDDEGWPFTVVRDGREFEVDIDVRVTELTPERKARREADAAELLERLKRFDPSKTRVGGES